MTKDSVIVNNRPILYIALATFLAVVISSVAIVTNTLFILGIIFILLIISLVICFSIISLRKTKIFYLLLFSLIAFTLVASNFIYTYTSYLKSDLTGESYFSGNVVDIGGTFTGDDGNIVKKIVVLGNVEKGNIKANIYVDSSLDVYVGSKVEFKGYFYKNEVVNERFNVYVLSDKVFYSATSVKLLTFYNSEIDGVFNKLKFNIYNGFRAVISKNYAVAYAMIVGDDSYIFNSIMEDFRYLGIAHIFSVSGLHIGFVYTLLAFIFKRVKVNNLIKLIISFLVLLLYVAFCGFTPSCMRAFIIICTSLLAGALFEKKDRFTSLLLAFTIVLLLNPYDLFTVGFILSFVVYFSLVFFTKPIYKVLSKFCFDWLAKFLAPYLAAFLGSFPLCLDFFGYVSAFSILFNIMLVPILGLVFILIFLLAIAILIFPFYGVLAVVPNIILNAVISFSSYIESNLFLIKGLTFGVSMAPYYALGIVNAKLINISKKLRFILTIVLIIIFILSIIAVNLAV